MRPQSLKTAEVLGSKKPHGHMMRYLAGCRCKKCRKGNVEYKAKLRSNTILYGPNDLVPVDRVRSFLAEMRKLGIGYKTIARHVGVGKTILGSIVWGKHKHGKGNRSIRRRTEKKILSYKPSLDTMPRTAKVPCEETVDKLNQLVQWGYPRGLIDREVFKNRTGALQIHAFKKHTPVVCVKTAVRVRDFFELVIAMQSQWKRSHGTIPRRHFVYWKRQRGRRSIKNLELREFSRNFEYMNLYTQEFKDVIRLKNKIKREVISRRKRQRDGKEQTHRPAQPSVRNARGVKGQRQANGDRPRQSHQRRGPGGDQLGKSGDRVHGSERGSIWGRVLRHRVQ